MFEKFNIVDRLKSKVTSTTVLESLVDKLESMSKTKEWSHEETGHNLALMLDPELALEEDDMKAEKDGSTEKAA